METTAQNLIEILEACSHNTGIPLDKLEVKICDFNWGAYYDINRYDVIQDCDDSYFVSLTWGC